LRIKEEQTRLTLQEHDDDDDDDYDEFEMVLDAQTSRDKTRPIMYSSRVGGHPE